MKKIGIVNLVLFIAAGMLSAQGPVWDWVKPLNTGDTEIAKAVASDPNTGEVYLAGEWRGALNVVFPAGATESTDFAATFGGVDGLVAKLDPGGNVRWAFKVGGEGDDRINDIHVDDKGFFYICGAVQNGNSSFAGTGIPDATTEFFNPGINQAFLSKYDPTGKLVWVRFAGELEYSEGRGIDTNQDAVFLTGHHRGIISFGVLPPYASVGGTDLFIIKYSPDGDERWHVSAGSDRDDFGEDIACDETHFYVAGRFNGSVLGYKDVSGGVISTTINTADGQDDGFIAGFTMDGFHEWTRIIASAADDDCRGVAIDNEFVYVAGTIGQEAIFPLYSANPVPYKGGLDAYICALGRTDGATKWVRTLAGDAGGDQVINDLSMDRSGSLYVTGLFTSMVNTVDANSDSKGLEDIFLASYERTGTIKWLKTAGGAGPDMGNGVCASTPGMVYLAGEYSDVTAFDSELLPADGGQNMFVARLNLDCMDAVGGSLSTPDKIIAEGEVLTLVLKDYIGDIRWQFALPDQNNWSLLTADLRDSIEVFPSGTADYRAFVTSGNCASDSSNVIRVTVGDTILGFAEAGPDVTICKGDSTNLKASGGDFYKWEPMDDLDQNDIPDPWAKPRITTTYLVHVTRADGVTDSDSVTVFVLLRPQLTVGADVSVCLGDEAQLNASGEGSFRWFPQLLLNDPTIPDPVASVDTTTIFRVVISNADGCRNAAIVTVFVFNPPMADAGPDSEIRAQFETTLNARLAAGDKGYWSVVTGNGIFEDPQLPVTKVTGLEIGDNVFEWHVSNGICPEITDMVTIHVHDFLIPTVITPNGDGKNDFFQVKGILSYRSSELIVLNRWGEEVYHASPYLNLWDGVNQNGKELPEDTYYIILKFSDNDVRKGTLMILR